MSVSHPTYIIHDQTTVDNQKVVKVNVVIISSQAATGHNHINQKWYMIYVH